MMSRPGLVETRRARRVLRAALAKCHDFERRRKLARLCPKCGPRGFYFVGVLAGVDSALLEIREQLSDDRSLFLVDAARQRTQRLSDALSEACRSGHRLEARFVATALWAHRALFRYLVDSKVGVRLAPDTWSLVSMPAIALWGDAAVGVAYYPIGPRRVKRLRPWSNRWRQRHLTFTEPDPHSGTPTRRDGAA